MEALAAVVQGKVQGAAAEALLNSYGQERRGHVRELTGRLKALGAIICERDVAKARARDAKLLAECGGTVKDTPRQDVLPRLTAGLLARLDSSGRGTLFAQPRLADGRLMDQRYGHAWRVIVDATIAAPAAASGLPVMALGDPSTLVHDGARDRERDGVVAAWMQRHACHAAVVRPDHCVYGTATTAAQLDALLAERHAALAF